MFELPYLGDIDCGLVLAHILAIVADGEARVPPF